MNPPGHLPAGRKRNRLRSEPANMGRWTISCGLRITGAESAISQQADVKSDHLSDWAWSALRGRTAADLCGDRLNRDRDMACAELEVRRAAERWAGWPVHAVAPQMTRWWVLPGALTAALSRSPGADVDGSSGAWRTRLAGVNHGSNQAQ